MYSLVVKQNGKIVDAWGDLQKLRLIARLRENEKLFNLTRKTDYKIGSVHYFEYVENAVAEIKEI